jgi:hypothetical protein
MKFDRFSLVLSMGITTFALPISPAQAQYLSVPVTNGAFTITNRQYTALPTFLTPAGTITITSGDASRAYFQNPTGAISGTDTSTAVFAYSLAGNASLNDSRTATFTLASAALRGQARVTGVASWSVASGGTGSTPAGDLPNGATVFFSQGLGAIHIPASALSNYTTPQFNIPITGGSFTLTDNPGTVFATLTLNSVLTPLGTTNLTVTSPDLNTNSYQGLAVYYASALSGRVGGLVNGSVALNDGRTATITNRLLSLNVNTQIPSGYPGGRVVSY